MDDKDWPVIKEGDKDPFDTGAVRSVQHLVNAHGAAITVDGVFGPETAQAVRDFQGSHGLGVDGIVGNETWPALIVVVHLGSRGDGVRAVQCEFDGLVVDGIFGPQTDKAARSFQNVFTPPADGIVGPETWFALVSWKSE